MPASSFCWEWLVKVGFFGICVAVLAAVGAGCGDAGWELKTKAATRPDVKATPEPINLLLPKAIRIHPFTGTRTFDETGGIKGIDVRIEAVDAFGDSTKAFGDFRFEVYRFVPNSLNAKGQQVATWEESVLEPGKNLVHWDKITRAYEFKLQWDSPIPVGDRFVLVAVFASPLTQRLFAERVFVSGQ
jgi:hypothetical protein